MQEYGNFHQSAKLNQTENQYPWICQQHKKSLSRLVDNQVKGTLRKRKTYICILSGTPQDSQALHDGQVKSQA